MASELTLTPLMSFIERAARDPDFDLVKFEAMLRLQREAEHEQAQRAFDAAMAEVQNEIGDIKRSGKNPTFSNPYAKLEDLDREARPIYTGRGFNIRYGSRLSTPDAPPLQAGHMRVVLIISHAGGYKEEHHLDGPIDSQTASARSRTPIQAVGSTVTYLRRYLLQMVLNLVPAGDPADDDGEGQRRTRGPQSGNGKPPSDDGGLDIDWTDEPKVQLWLAKLAQGLGMMRHQSEIDEAANGPKVTDGRARAPDRVRVEIDALFAEAYARTLASEAEG